MNTTKQNILATSLTLFNIHGISEVSLRTIADEVGISVGNLQYHFKKRETIIEALYFQIIEKIDTITILPSQNLLASFFSISNDMIAILYEYRFFFLDFVTITRKNKKIKENYALLSKRRESEFLAIVTILIDNELFRAASLQNEYHTVFKRIELISNFWFSAVLIQADVLQKDTTKEYSLLISQCIYPYLTNKGKLEYARLFPSQLL